MVFALAATLSQSDVARSTTHLRGNNWGAEEEVAIISLGTVKADVWHQFGFKKKHDIEKLDKNDAICQLCKLDVQ